MANPVPLTIQAAKAPDYGNTVVIGSNSLSLPYNQQNLYWIIILDPADLSVKANFTFSDNSSVPSQLNPYLNGQYIMILSSQALNSTNLPQGAFYQFLVKEGADYALRRIEQIYEALNCGTWGTVAYTLVAVLGSDNTSYEYETVIEPVLLATLQLMPVTIGGKTTYIPAEI
ncbi:MAG: hypothetical protein KDC80_23325 [Saprospiraceae bacterium]|nr:hypothetical protein [Saprospiraceae bacterium]